MESSCGSAIRTGKAHKIEGVKLNAVLGDPIDWLPDNKTVIVKTDFRRRAAGSG